MSKTRRTLLQLCGAALAQPLPLFAQAERRFRIGCLYLADEPLVRPFQAAFVEGLRERGYVAGRNLTIDLRSASGDSSRLPALVDELISLQPDVLFGIETMAVVMKARTATIPIVVPVAQDPVASGLVKSLARPGTNVTGLASASVERIGKHVELLAEINPKMTKIALLNDPLDASAPLFEKYARSAAAAKQLAFVSVGAKDAAEVRRAFETIERERAEAVVVAATGRTNHLRQDIVNETRRLRLPDASGHSAAIWIQSGGLISNSIDLHEAFRYAAGYVDRIFRGAKPQDLPMEMVGKFLLVINLKEAAARGISIPQSVLLRADRVIE